MAFEVPSKNSNQRFINETLKLNKATQFMKVSSYFQSIPFD